jgi:phosphoribosylaminoimidazole-succinocarboxamide synthase
MRDKIKGAPKKGKGGHIRSRRPLLIRGTDRLSAFDVVSHGHRGQRKVPDKLSLFWFRQMEDIIANHIIETMWTGIRPLRRYADALGQEHARRKRGPALECVARGYLAGSGWRNTGSR